MIEDLLPADVESLPDLPTLPSLVPELSDLPGAMSLSALAERSMSEIDNYRRGEPSNDQYSLEIFRRAMLERDNAAWTLLENRFKDFLLGSFRRHPKSEAASHLDSPENYVARAFARFWLAAVHNQQLEFTTLAAALRYLRGCLNSTIVDALRAYSRAKEVALPEPDFGWEPVVEEHDDGRDLWEAISGVLPGERERRLAYLLYHCNLKPREVVRLCPQEFHEVEEIYRLRRNIIERVQRSADQIRWKLNGEKAWER
jgi:DNA-directed RNA polymerase specialized sigma24 family protein